MYGKKLGITINECTIKNFKKAYNEEMLTKQASSGQPLISQGATNHAKGKASAFG